MNVKKVLKQLVSFIIILILILTAFQNSYAAGLTVSKSSITMNEGKSESITINATTLTGRVNISSSNSNVASVNLGSVWVENEIKTITISAKSTGTSVITISGELYDAETEDEKVYTKTVNVTVNKVVENNTNTSQGTTNSSGSNTNTNTNSNTNSNASSSNKPQTNNTSTNNTTSTNKPTTTKPSTTNQSSNTNNNIEQSQQVESNDNVVEENVTEIESSENIMQEEQIEAIVEENTEIKTDSNTTNIDKSNKKFIIISIIGISVLIILVTIVILKRIWKK